MIRYALLAGVMSLLAACDNTQIVEIFSPGETIYDGVWVGQLAVVRRNSQCQMTRSGVRTRVESGVINGLVRYGSNRGRLVGVLREDGTVRTLQMAGEFSDSQDIEFEGSFGETEASGTWTQVNCSGEWTLRKAR